MRDFAQRTPRSWVLPRLFGKSSFWFLSPGLLLCQATLATKVPHHPSKKRKSFKRLSTFCPRNHLQQRVQLDKRDTHFWKKVPRQRANQESPGRNSTDPLFPLQLGRGRTRVGALLFQNGPPVGDHRWWGCQVPYPTKLPSPARPPSQQRLQNDGE